jgi:hypothetical protein
MANTADKNRKQAKAAAVVARLAEIHDSREMLIGMLDEGKLDLIILAFGIGVVRLQSEDDAP